MGTSTGKTSYHVRAWLKDIHDDISQRPARCRSALSGISSLARERLGHFAEGGTGRASCVVVDGSTGPSRLHHHFRPSFVASDSCKGKLRGASSREERGLLVSAECTQPTMWEKQTAWSCNGRALPHLICHQPCELIRVTWFNNGKSACSRWNTKCDIEASIPSLDILICRT